MPARPAPDTLRTPGRRGRRTRVPAAGEQAGQAAAEYAALLTVVALVLLAGMGVARATSVSNGVIRGLQRGLCIATGTSCPATRLDACTVRSRETGGRLGVQITLIKLGGSLSLLREEKSDGTVDVTLIDGRDVGATATLGASGGVRLGGKWVGGGAISHAELVARLGRRRVWHRPDAASAERLMAQVRESVATSVITKVPGVGPGARRLAHAFGYHGDQLPRPDEDAISEGAQAAVEAGLGPATAGMTGSLGGTWNRRTGRRSLVFSIEGKAAVTLAAGTGVDGNAGVTVVVTYDRRGAPEELTMTVAGTAQGRLGVDLPSGARTKGTTGERVEVAARLGLQSPGGRAAYDGLAAALAHGRAAALPAAALALAEQLRSAARFDVSRYAARSVGYGAKGLVGAVAGLGGSAEVTRTTSELRDAWTRPAGGAWEQRTECLNPAVHA